MRSWVGMERLRGPPSTPTQPHPRLRPHPTIPHTPTTHLPHPTSSQPTSRIMFGHTKSSFSNLTPPPTFHQALDLVHEMVDHIV